MRSGKIGEQTMTTYDLAVALAKQLEEKQTALADLRDSLRDADPTERRILREQIAMLEDSIDLIEGRLA